MTHRAQIASVFFAALACASCSLAVGDLRLQCDEPSDCAALNDAEGLDLTKDCFVYQCRNDGRGCEKRAQDLDGDGALAPACKTEAKGPVDCDDSWESGTLRAPGRQEECDGHDNDCDGVIDDGAFTNSPPPQPDHPSIGNRNIVHLSHAVRESGAYLALTSRQGKEFATGIWQYNPSSPTSTFSGGVDLKTGANDACVATDGSGGSCVLTELVLTAEPDVLLTLGINLAGCAGGEARAGAAGSGFTPGDDRLVWATSLSRADCLRKLPDAPVGASHASLALLAPPTGTPQALALWRAEPGGARTFAPLTASGLWLDKKGSEPPEIRSVNGDEAQQLPLSNGQDTASVAAWYGHDAAGYFVAYDTAQAVKLTFVPALAGPTAAAMDGWLTASLDEKAPRHVALALGESDSAHELPAGLAAAWRTEAGEIRFARFSFDRDTHALTAETPETLQPATTIVDGPEIVYLPQGFADHVSAPRASTGGWFVAWVEGTGTTSRMVGVRVPEASPERELPFLIFQGHRLAHLFAYQADDTTSGYGFIDAEADAQQLYIGSLKCDPKI